MLFKKILIANRGEIAVRGINACKGLAIPTVAVYSRADSDSMPVKIADEAVILEGDSRGAYYDIEQIIKAAKRTGADGIFPGYAFLSEREDFALACEQEGIKFIGPCSDTISKMGNKSEARDIAAGLGVPLARGSSRIKRLDDGRKIISSIGYPLKIMADKGGGGKGTRFVRSESELDDKFNAAQQEGITYAGNSHVSIVEFIPDVRHIEVQILGDSYGNAIHLETRDCTIQRRNQKLIEEGPAPHIDLWISEAIKKHAVDIAKAVNYRGAGTVEFLVSGGRYVFGEMNTRIQVEHPVSEMITGVDIVREMIRVSAGEPLRYSQEDISQCGHSIECRINAEDPDNFYPSPGRITKLMFPQGKGIRVDSHLYESYDVPIEYDSLVAKLVVHDKDRKNTIQKMKKALDGFCIEGIKTNIPLHLDILKDKDFQNGDYTTDFIVPFTERIKRLKSLLYREESLSGNICYLAEAHGCWDHNS